MFQNLAPVLQHFLEVVSIRAEDFDVMCLDFVRHHLTEDVLLFMGKLDALHVASSKRGVHTDRNSGLPATGSPARPFDSL
jgi:hypothetical protein